MPLPEKLENLAEQCPFPLYVVGGFVRDFLAGLESATSDIDICAPADAEEFVEVAKKCGGKPVAVYKNTGTVKLKLGGEEYEFASFRSDEYVRGTHKPVKSLFTDDMLLDAHRRDFKCNAVYYDIKNQVTVDPLGGLKDIMLRRITTVADAEKVFGEDGLRLMRLARQAAQTGFKPTEECLRGARSNASLISDIAPERIFTELNYILHADEKYGIERAQYDGLKILAETDVLNFILPELAMGRDMKQNPDFHDHDVLEHSLRTVMYADKSIRLAALLHDVGKPYALRETGSYREHERDSARIAGDVCARLKVSKRITTEVVRLCALHMYDMRCDARENKVRKFIVHNIDIFDKLLLIKQADYSACRDDLGEAPCVTKWKEIYEKLRAEGVPLTLRQLKIGGDDLIEAGVAPTDVSKMLKTMFDDCIINPAHNKRKTLLKRALSLYNSGNF